MSAPAPGDGIWIRVRHVAPAQEEGIRIDLFGHGRRHAAIEDERGPQQIWEEGGSGQRRVKPSTLAAQEFGSYWEAVRRSQELLLRSAALLARSGTTSAEPISSMGGSQPIPMHSPSSNNPSRPSRRSTTHLDAIQIIRRAYVHSYRDRARTAAAMAADNPIAPPEQRLPLWRPPGAASLPSSPPPAATASSPAPPAQAPPPARSTTPRPRALLGRLHLGALPVGLYAPMGAAVARARRTSIRVERLMLAAKQQRHARALAKAPAASHDTTPQTAPDDHVNTPVYQPGKAWGRRPVEAASSSRPGSGAATPAYVPIHQPAASKGQVEHSSRDRRSVQGLHEEAGAEEEGYEEAGAEQEEGRQGTLPPDSKKAVRRRLLKELKTAAGGEQPQPLLREWEWEMETREPLPRLGQGGSGPFAAGVRGFRAAAAAAVTVPAVSQQGRQSRVQASAAGPSYASPTESSLQRRSPAAADKQRRARAASKQRQVEQAEQRRAAVHPAAALGAVLGRGALPESTQRLRDHIRLLRAAARAGGVKGPGLAEASGEHAGAGSAQGAALLPGLGAGRRSQQLAMVATLAAATAFGMAAAALRDPEHPAALPPAPDEHGSSALLAVPEARTALSQPPPWGNVGVSGLPKLTKRVPGQPLALNPLPLAASPLMHVSVSGNMVVDVSDTLELTVPLQVEVDFEVSPALLAELHAAAERSLPVT